MTEAEWLECTDPRPMLDFLRSNLSERKQRLIACACCHLILDLIPTEESLECVRVAERYADGTATPGELNQSIEVSMAACEKDSERRRLAGTPWSWIEVQAINAVGRVHRTTDAGREGVFHAAEIARAWDHCLRQAAAGNESYFREEDGCLVIRQAALQQEAEVERAKQATLLRDVARPVHFRPVLVSSAWLTSTVMSLAQMIYDDLAFDRMPILGDALEEAGCDQAEILEHCRGPGPHAKGCWVVDRLLGKE